MLKLDKAIRIAVWTNRHRHRGSGQDEHYHTWNNYITLKRNASGMDNVEMPPPVSRGGQVAIIAPASGGAAGAKHIFKLGLDRLAETFAVEPIVHPTARQSDDFLRSHPRARAAAVHEAFRDPDIEGVMATIGGDDQLRVLKHLDPAVLRSNPTRFYGLSDNANLSLYLATHGIGSYYGAQLMTELAVPGPLPEYTEMWLRRALFEETLGKLEPPERWTDMTVGWHRPAEEFATTDPGYQSTNGWEFAGSNQQVSGPVWGGCLSIVEWQLSADRYLPAPERLDGAILALETSETLPKPSDVGGALCAMGERGLLERFAGVLVARPATETWQQSRTDDERERYRSLQREAVREQVERYAPDAPIVFDLDFGHTNPTAPIPVGGHVEIDPEKRQIAFE